MRRGPEIPHHGSARAGKAALLGLSALLLVLLPSCRGGQGGGPGGATALEGSVEALGAPVAGVFVEAFDRAPDGVASAVASANSDSAGRFSLALPPGRYWVTARKKPQGGTGAGMLYGAAPGPVKVAAGAAPLSPIVLADSSGEGAAGAGTPVTGTVSAGGKPRAGAFVYLYPEDRSRGPAYAAKGRTRADGSFRLFAPPGRYRLVARLRGDGESMGTLAPGDLVGEGAGGTLGLGKEPVDAGPIALHPVDEKLLPGRGWAAGEGGLAVSGRVTDEGGKAVAGVYLFLYPDHRMVGKPSALSAPTGKDGAFQLEAPGPGTWYLGARSRYGGPVEPGEVMGVYEVDGQRAPVTLLAGAPPLRADIVVKEVW